MLFATELLHAIDPVTFAEEALGFTPDPWQSSVLRSPARRHILNCSRQAGKSTVASIMAVHQSVYVPGSLTLLISPSIRQSGELFRKVSDAIHRLGRTARMPEDNRLSLQLENGSRVVSLPGSEATIRGFSSPDLVIEDEAARVLDETHAAPRPMLAVSGGRLVLMSTPRGQRGHFFDTWTSPGDGWERTLITGYDVPRIDRAWLENERRELGDMFFRSEYLGEFVADINSVFRSADIEAAMTDDVKPLKW